MFGFLNMLSQGLNYMGFFNVGTRGSKVLNQVYIIAGILGDIYLFYAGGRFIINGFLIHGALIILAAVALIYFLYINFYFYFLKREAPMDVSPMIEKKLGLKRFNAEANRSLDHLQNLPEQDALRVDREIQHSIPARLAGDAQTHRNVQAMLNDLVRNRHLRSDYAGLNSLQLFQRLKRDHHRPVYAIGAGVLVPVCHMRNVQGDWRVFAGNDPGHERYIGKVARVGMQQIQDVNATRSWNLVLTAVVVVGGPYQILGRSRVYSYQLPYHLQVYVRFRRNRY